jgi:hypothetical protein
MLMLVMSAALWTPPAKGQVVIVPAPGFGMGFSAGSISSVANGVPVYAVGDQLWVESYLNESVTVEVTNPAGINVADAPLEPMSPLLAYSFSSTDQGGAWELWATIPQLPGVREMIPVTQFAFVANESVSPAMTGYHLGGEGLLTMNFFAPALNSYDVGACIVGSPLPVVAEVPLPGSLGNGQLELRRQNTTMVVNLDGNVTAPFTFWAELHGGYSYSLNGNSTLVSRDLEVASSEPVDVTAGFAGTTTVMEYQVIPRTGRLSLWAFFESSQGLSVWQVPLLLFNSTAWISLEGCSATANGLAPAFSVSVSLGQKVSEWPRAIFLMYEVDGVEMFSAATIPLMPAKVSFEAEPWGKALTDSRFTVTSENGAEEVSAGNGTFYLVAENNPLEVAVSPSAGESGGVVLLGAFSATNLNVSSGKALVQTLVNGKPFSGMNVAVDENGEQVASIPSSGGEATFYLPVGNYTITGSYGNSTISKTLRAQDGIQSSVSLDFIVSESPGAGPILNILILFATLGAATSVVVWLQAYRRPSSPH